jgi:hypothetical protein
VNDPSSSFAVQQHLSACGGEQDPDPLDPPPRKADELQYFQEERPGDRIEGLCNINLLKNSGKFLAVEPP